MHPPMMDRVSASHIDDMRRTADRSRTQSGSRGRAHAGTTIARVIGMSLIRVGRRLAGPDVRNEPRILTVRGTMGDLHTQS